MVACCTSTTCAYYHRHSCTNTFRSSPPFGGSSPSAVFLLLHTPQASHIHTRAIATAVEFLRSTQLLPTHTAHTERTARTDMLHALHSRCLYTLHYTLGVCVLYCTALSVMCTLHCKCMTVPCTPPSTMYAQCPFLVDARSVLLLFAALLRASLLFLDATPTGHVLG